MDNPGVKLSEVKELLMKDDEFKKEYDIISRIRERTAKTTDSIKVTDMNNTIEYKGYIGSIEFSAEDTLFFGKVLGIRALISYEGENAHDLIESFHEAVDDYLEMCRKNGIKPEKAYNNEK